MIPIDKLFGWSNYMKYDEMNEITIKMFKDTEMENADEVNIYFDLGSMVSYLYSNITEVNKDPTTLASIILNLAAHVRMFFRSRCRVYATIFFIFSFNNSFILQKLCSSYIGSPLIDKKKNITDYIKKAIKLVEMISIYLPNVYYISGDMESGGILYNTILKERQLGNTNPNIIFTKEYNLLQISAIDDKTVIYYKQISNRNRICFGIRKDNVVESYLKLTKRFNTIYTNPNAIVIVQMVCDDISKTRFIGRSNRINEIGNMIMNFDPKLLSYFIALTNLPHKGFRSILSWTRAMEGLYSIQHKYIDDPEWIYNNLKVDLKIFNVIGYEEFINRYNAINIKFQSMLYDKEPQKNYKIDIDNPDELKYLNDHYFGYNYIDLNKF